LIRVALKGLAGRKLRAVLTSFAIVLGVAMVSGTYVLTDTIDKAFEEIFVDSYRGTDAVVTGQEADISFQGDTAEVPSVPANLLERIREVDGVEAATGSIVEESAAKILDPEGKVVETEGAPSFGFGLDPSQDRFNPLNLLDGTWPNSPDEVVIDSGTANDQEYGVGDTVRIASLKAVRPFQIVGIARYGEVESLGSATFSVFTIPTAQELFDRENSFDTIQAGAEPGVTPEQLVERIAPLLPENAQVQTADEQADDDSGEISEFTSFFRYFLLAFAGIALFVGAFVIFNTLSITVAQRTREFATLRTIGASRRQLLSSVIVEALAVGVLASLIGLGLGYGLAEGLNWLFVQLNIDLPQTGTVVATRTIVVALTVGIVVTLLASVVPALRATRVPPIAAVREGATLPPGRLAPFTPYIALVVVALAVALLSYAMFVDDVRTLHRLLSIAGGVLALFIGVAMLSSKAVPPLSIILSPVARLLMFVFRIVFFPLLLGYWLFTTALGQEDISGARQGVYLTAGVVLLLLTLPILLLWLFVKWVLGVLGWMQLDWPTEFPHPLAEPAARQIASENSRRNPGRTAATAAALMIGIALVAFVAVLAEGFRVSNSEAINEQVQADYVLTSTSGFEPFVAAAGEAVARTPGIELATDVRSEIGQVSGSGKYVTGIDPERITQVYRFDWIEGSDAVLGQLGGFGAIIDDDFADEEDLGIGDRFDLVTPDGEQTLLEVKGIYNPPPFYPLLGSVSIAQSRFDLLYDRPRNQFTFVNVPGDPSESTKTALVAAAADFPDAKVQTRDEWIQLQEDDLAGFLNLLYVLLALSVIVSIFGMVNTLVLSVFERTRELGMLRAVGLTRRQARRMIRHESVITSLIGAALGLPLGVFLALLVTEALSQFEVQFRVPWFELALFAVISAIVGIVAAVFPARRAARLNVLQALQYE
jgi:ABC-type antimicrobial peptide transport system permease subunit